MNKHNLPRAVNIDYKQNNPLLMDRQLSSGLVKVFNISIICCPYLQTWMDPRFKAHVEDLINHAN